MFDRTKNNIRCTAQGAAIVLAIMAISPLCRAEHLGTIQGVAVVEDSETLAIDGQRLSLWGIDMLAPDQQCWQGDEAWPCGEEALIALKHLVSGRTVECELQTAADAESPALARCYRWKNSSKIDIAQYMINHGWALERGVTSGGIYYRDEQAAQTAKRGAWSGRFQTAQDWRDGVQRFVGEDDTEVPAEDQTQD